MKSLEPEMSRAPVRMPVAPPADEAMRRDAEAGMDTLLRRVGVRTRGDLPDQPVGVPAAVEATPLHNYPGPGFEHMTTQAWNRLPASCRGSWMERSAGNGGAARRVRVALTADADLLPVYLMDSVRTDLPSLGA